MYKTTFNFFSRTTYQFSKKVLPFDSIFAKLFLTCFVFILSANGIPDWQGNKNKSLEDWKWVEVKPNNPVDIVPPFILPDTDWAQRAGLQALNHKGKFYIFGGRTPLPFPAPFGASIIHGDGWRSSDKGSTWERILNSNPPTEIPGVGIVPSDPNLTEHWANRSYFQAVKKGNYMYILGGQDFNLIKVPDPEAELCPDPDSGVPIPCVFIDVPFSQFFNDVWRSRDGFNWRQMIQNQAINPTHWAGRAGLSAVVFKGYIYVMGGSQNDDCAIINCIPGAPPPRKYFNDVWRSRDGSSWEMVKENIEIEPGDTSHWAQRAGGIAVVKNGYMYMIGGENGFICLPFPGAPCPPYFNDVWRTKDGFNWELVIADAPWAKRPGHQVVVAQNQLVLFGGFGLGETNGVEPANPTDVWTSYDGKTWVELTNSPWNADEDSPEKIKYDFDAVVEKGYGKYSDAIYTFGGDRETFNRGDNTNWKNVDNDVWKFSLPKKKVDEVAEDAIVFAIKQNYPNPFSASTTIAYTIPSRAHVSIKVLDQYGRFVSRLVKRTKNAGAYEINWDGKNYKGRSVKQGYYYAVLWSNGKLKTIKMYKN